MLFILVIVLQDSNNHAKIFVIILVIELFSLFLYPCISKVFVVRH